MVTLQGPKSVLTPQGLIKMNAQWSKWRRFPHPERRGLLVAPIGPGCYELRNGPQLVLCGKGEHVAFRMSSLLPAPFGCGTRNNAGKRAYVLDNLQEIEYRTLACATFEEATACENELRRKRSMYLFST